MDSVRRCFWENVSGLAARILRNFKLSAQDSALVISSSDANVVSIEMAEQLRRVGMKVVVIISKRHSEATPSKRSAREEASGFWDLMLDTGAPPGDAMWKIDGLKTSRLAPDRRSGGVC